MTPACASCPWCANRPTRGRVCSLVALSPPEQDNRSPDTSPHVSRRARIWPTCCANARRSCLGLCRCARPCPEIGRSGRAASRFCWRTAGRMAIGSLSISCRTFPARAALCWNNEAASMAMRRKHENGNGQEPSAWPFINSTALRSWSSGIAGPRRRIIGERSSCESEPVSICETWFGGFPVAEDLGPAEHPLPSTAGPRCF